MRIEGNKDNSKFRGIGLVRSGVDKSSMEGASGTLNTFGLLRQLKVLPETRADKVARAKALVLDPAYPTDADLNKVAKVLAAKIGNR